MSNRFWEIVEEITFPLLVTNGKDGFPQARPMRLLAYEGRRLWFATSRSSNKTGEIAANAQVTVIFADTERFNYACLHGRAHLIADEERKRRLWQNAWTDDWPKGPRDPDYLLIEVVGEYGVYYRGYTDERGTVDLHA
ncbi:pyridoxamine 5'-phosphate oxidase family protein [Candidatus Bipolaricaulota bacterium]|nr:pyridoxamine 5'-phosphate oxidase family protein [Candidatus Bipolaricaulota bacterium]